MKRLTRALLLALVGVTVVPGLAVARSGQMLTGRIDAGLRDDIVLHLDGGRGISIWFNDEGWFRLHPLSPDQLVVGDLGGNGQDEVVIDFGPQYGVWVWVDNSRWVKLHDLSPEQMVTGDLDGNGQDEVIIDFGPLYGVWVWVDNSNWVKLHLLSPVQMITGDLDGNGQDEVVVDFGPHGVWIWVDNSRWVKLHDLSPEQMITGDLDGNGQDEVVVDFGPHGVWVWVDNSRWVKLHDLSPEQMVTGNLDGSGRDEVIIDFGPRYGVWVWVDNSRWVKLHDFSPVQIVTGDLDGSGRDEVIIDFGPPYGIWIWENNLRWRELATGYSPSLSRTSGRQLLVRRRLSNGSLGVEAPYVIRGVVWSPAGQMTNTSPSDRNNAHVRRPEFGAWYRQDIPLMAAMHVNTVRLPIDLGFDPVLGPIGLAVLDDLYQHGIMAVMTVDDAIGNPDRIVNAVNFYKNHPAILMWSIGSEWNLNRYFGVYPTVQAAAAATEASAQLIKSLDSNHPVATNYGDIDVNLPGFVTSIVPSVDVWSLNVYRGNTFDSASGSLFDQWRAISSKPMFIGEFGVDAFHGRCLSNPPTGSLNEMHQVAWTIDLWNDIARNLSAVDPDAAAIGGTVFEWNDEWWKVSPPGSQQTGGWTSDGFPDWHGTEEFFGIVDIRRVPRQLYAALAAAFDPTYLPPPHTTTFRAISRGANLCGAQADFRRDGWTFYQRFGGGGGGRGFNIATADPGTGTIIDAGRNFDTWGGGAAAKNALVSYIGTIPNGRLVMLAVADEAGLNPEPALACVRRTDAATVALVAALEALGSALIGDYCWRGSWAMVVIKGSGAALAEDYQRTEEARAEAPVQTPGPSATLSALAGEAWTPRRRAGGDDLLRFRTPRSRPTDLFLTQEARH